MESILRHMVRPHVMGPVDVMGPVENRCMFWDVFGAQVVGHVVHSCFRMRAGPMFWDVFGVHILGHVLGL